MDIEEMREEIEWLRKQNTRLLEVMRELLVRFREWEPSFFDSGRSDTDLGEAISKAKHVLAGKEGE